jgi:predicted ferric reductase
VAWVLLIALIVAAARRHDPNKNYDRWRFWHATAALLILVFGLHHTLDAGLYSSLPVIQYFWWCLSIIAIGSLTTIYLIRPILQRGKAYRVQRVVKYADDTYGVTLLPKSLQFDSPQPGQFFWIKRGSPLAHTDHPFSVAGFEPTTGAITFLIKAVGDFTREIPSLKPGEDFYLDGPHGDFGPPDDATVVVMIAGGIGCAPFLSMVQALSGSVRKVLLITATKTASEQLETLPGYPENTHAMQSMIAWARVVEHPTAEWAGDVGRCDIQLVTKNLKRYAISPTDQGTYFLLCGPGPMMSTLEADLVGIGVNLRNIDSERYQYDLNPRSPITRRYLRRWMGLSAGMLLLAITAAIF